MSAQAPTWRLIYSDTQTEWWEHIDKIVVTGMATINPVKAVGDELLRGARLSANGPEVASRVTYAGRDNAGLSFDVRTIKPSEEIQSRYEGMVKANHHLVFARDLAFANPSVDAAFQHATVSHLRTQSLPTQLSLSLDGIEIIVKLYEADGLIWADVVQP